MTDEDNTANAALEEAKKKLFEKAKKDGKIDQRDIFSAIPDTPDNVDILDSLYTELADAAIQITSPADPKDGVTDPWVADEEEEVVPEEQVYLDDIADDSVRLYLREIGKIPLLKA